MTTANADGVSASSWTTRARWLLPVPVSPAIKTVVSSLAMGGFAGSLHRRGSEEEIPQVAVIRRQPLPGGDASTRHRVRSVKDRSGTQGGKRPMAATGNGARNGGACTVVAARRSMMTTRHADSRLHVFKNSTAPAAIGLGQRHCAYTPAQQRLSTLRGVDESHLATLGCRNDRLQDCGQCARGMHG